MGTKQEGPQRLAHGRQGNAHCKGHELLAWKQGAQLGRLGRALLLDQELSIGRQF